MCVLWTFKQAYQVVVTLKYIAGTVSWTSKELWKPLCAKKKIKNGYANKYSLVLTLVIISGEVTDRIVTTDLANFDETSMTTQKQRRRVVGIS